MCPFWRVDSHASLIWVCWLEIQSHGPKLLDLLSHCSWHLCETSSEKRHWLSKLSCCGCCCSTVTHKHTRCLYYVQKAFGSTLRSSCILLRRHSHSQGDQSSSKQQRNLENAHCWDCREPENWTKRWVTAARTVANMTNAEQILVENPNWFWQLHWLLPAC